MHLRLPIARSAMAAIIMLTAGTTAGANAAEQQPNILWITAEDMSCNLGCYRDEYAATPHIDRLAEQSARYTHAFATAPVCSPARSCLITGVYATSLGTQSLRSCFPIPSEFRGFPSYLRAAGYYCSNNVKTDYNTSNEPAIIKASWDECSATAHWRGRRADQPFFSVFNTMLTHQSRTSVWSFDQFEAMIEQRLQPNERHDPLQAPVPPYYPDTPTVRRTLARYYDCISAMDKEVGRILGQLDSDGLADSTIVFFYSDHGAGLPRGKRVLHDSGLRVPLLIRFPAKFRDLAPADRGTTLDRLVSFVDFTPTVLSLAGVAVPEYMQGRVFLGPATATPRQYVFGARDRVDEAYDLSRAVRDNRYLYIRNYMPHISWMQPERFSDNADMRREMKRLATAGRLDAAQLTYAALTKAREELYDTANDPHQIHNLAESAQHRAILERMREAQQEWSNDTRDLAFAPEAVVWERLELRTPWELARDVASYPQSRLLAAAELIGQLDMIQQQTKLLSADDSGVRYWAAAGLRAAGRRATAAHSALVASLDDPSPTVRIEAAAALAAQGDAKTALPALARELTAPWRDTALHAARTLQLMGEDARSALPAMKRTLDQIGPSTTDEPLVMFIRFSLEAAIEELKGNLEP